MTSKSRVSLPFSLRGPIPIQLEDSYSGAPTGLAVMDIIFAQVLVEEVVVPLIDVLLSQGESVSELKFRNSYTASLTVLVKLDQGSHPGFTPRREQLLATKGDVGEGREVGSRGRMDWMVAIRRRKLMENPHYETGSQEEVVILAAESKVPLEDVLAMRLILRQPSPEWRAFTLEELAVFRETVVPGVPTQVVMVEVVSGSVSVKNASVMIAQAAPQPSRLEVLRKQTSEALRGQVCPFLNNCR